MAAMSSDRKRVMICGAARGQLRVGRPFLVEMGGCCHYKYDDNDDSDTQQTRLVSAGHLRMGT